MNVKPISPIELQNRLVQEHQETLISTVNDLLIQSGKGNDITITRDDLIEAFQKENVAGLVWLAENRLETLYGPSGWDVTLQRGDVGPNENPGPRWTFTTKERDWR